MPPPDRCGFEGAGVVRFAARILLAWCLASPVTGVGRPPTA